MNGATRSFLGRCNNEHINKAAFLKEAFGQMEEVQREEAQTEGSIQERTKRNETKNYLQNSILDDEWT
jgi:hypothetical protein